MKFVASEGQFERSFQSLLFQVRISVSTKTELSRLRSGSIDAFFHCVFPRKKTSHDCAFHRKFLLFFFQCFMNSMLQCLSNTSALRLICLNDAYIPELSVNSTMKGSLFKGKSFHAFTQICFLSFLFTKVNLWA